MTNTIEIRCPEDDREMRADRTNDPRVSQIRHVEPEPFEVFIAEKNYATRNWHSKSSENWMECYPWLIEAIGLERNGRDEIALQKVYSTLNGWLVRREFDRVNTLLKVAKTDDISDDFLLAFLTITLEFHRSLPLRNDFFRRARDTIDRRETNEPGLLDGLG